MTKRDISKPASSRKGAQSWRAVIKIHPAGLEYPRLTEAELRELAADIVARGLQNNIVLVREGGEDLLLDGISRLDALEAGGTNLVAGDKLDPTLGLGGGARVRVVIGVDPYALAASLNAHRRHLTAEQKRERLEALIKQDPEKSDRQIAKAAKTNHKAVGRARKRLESTGTVSQLEKRTGADGKSRKQPRQRSSSDVGNVPPLKEAVAFADAVNSGGERTKAAAFAPARGDELVWLQARIGELENENQQQRIKNTGLEFEIEELRAARPTTLLAALELAATFSTDEAMTTQIMDIIKDLKRRSNDPTVMELTPAEAKALVATINRKNNDTSWRIDSDGRGGFHMVVLDTDGNVDTSHSPEQVEDLLAMAADLGVDVEKIRRDATRPPPQITTTRH